MLPFIIFAVVFIALYMNWPPESPTVSVVISEETVKQVQGQEGDQPTTFVMPKEVVYYLQGKSGNQIIKVDVEHPNQGLGLKLGLRKKYVEMVVPSEVVLTLQGKVGEQSVSMNLPAQIVADLQGKRGAQKLVIFI
jgi:hypothetical protein